MSGRLTGSLVVVLFVFVFLIHTNAIPAQDFSHPSVETTQSGKNSMTPVVDMPFASIDEELVIGCTDIGGGQRRWLAESLASGEVLPMHRAYPRFPTQRILGMTVSRFETEINYGGDASADEIWLQRTGFPKWRASQGRLVLSWRWGMNIPPIVERLASGVAFVPFHGEAIDYQVPGYEYEVQIENDVLHECEYITTRLENGKKQVRQVVFEYTRNVPLDHYQAVLRRTSYPLLHVQNESYACYTCDFVLSSSASGLFFTCPGPSTQITKQPHPSSRMTVFKYSVSDEGDATVRLDENRIRVRRERQEAGLPTSPATRSPDTVASMKWTEEESFDVPFLASRLPFTAAIDGCCYYFVASDGAIYRAPPGSNGGRQRVCRQVFRHPADPIIACIHDSSTNRIFAFRRESYIPVDNGHFPDNGPPRFVSCDDITHSKPLSFVDENGERRLADARFRLVSQAARVLHEDGMCR